MWYQLPEGLHFAKGGLTILCLVLLWTWESLFPLVVRGRQRWRHAGRNVTIALLNRGMLWGFLGATTTGVALWTEQHQFGCLYWLPMSSGLRFVVALLLLDGWLYVWHRLNHTIPVLWRCHRMHHADNAMDVTTATRFHSFEQLIGALLRLPLLALWGVRLSEILWFETLVVAMTMFHHANLSLGLFDATLRGVLVTPQMHQIHHSREPIETNSNYAVIFSFWDRFGFTFRVRATNSPVDVGLHGFDDDRWQTVWGMFMTPFVSPHPSVATETCTEEVTERSAPEERPKL